MRVLIVDDEASIRESLGLLLQEQGKSTEARSQFEGIVARNPQSVSALTMIGMIVWPLRRTGFPSVNAPLMWRSGNVSWRALADLLVSSIVAAA